MNKILFSGLLISSLISIGNSVAMEETQQKKTDAQKGIILILSKETQNKLFKTVLKYSKFLNEEDVEKLFKKDKNTVRSTQITAH